MFHLVTHQADRSVWRNSLPVKNMIFTDCCCCNAINRDQQPHFISLQCRINQNAARSYASDPVALSGFCVIKFFVQRTGTSVCKIAASPTFATSHLCFYLLFLFLSLLIQTLQLQTDRPAQKPRHSIHCFGPSCVTFADVHRRSWWALNFVC